MSRGHWPRPRRPLDPQADPDQVEADTLAQLIAEAEGTAPTSNGWGFVPEANGRSYDVNPLPTSDPRLTATAARRRRPPWRTVALAGGVLAAGLLYSGLLLRGYTATAADGGSRRAQPAASCRRRCRRGRGDADAAGRGVGRAAGRAAPDQSGARARRDLCAAD